jgi:hypothetical protein
MAPLKFRAFAAATQTLMKWRITQPWFDGDQVDRERSFRRTLCELETLLNLFVLVNEKSQREAAATGGPLFLRDPLREPLAMHD